MKKTLSLIIIAVFCISIMNFFNAPEKTTINYSEVPVIIFPPARVPGKKVKTITPSKRRVVTTVYRTMA